MNSRRLFLALVLVFLAGCAALPPGSDFPKTRSVAIDNPQSTRLGKQFETAARKNGGNSGFRMLAAGVDGFLTRVQLANAAERTLDLQYFILRGDETGQLLADAVLRAADRGVRIRVLIDDGETIVGDEKILALNAHPLIELRIFNPFAYRGHSTFLRGLEFAASHARLDYRMHNKLFIADGAVALIGGRNIGDQYFQVDPDSQFADDDVFTAGPIVKDLSATFDDFWNSAFSIPAQALTWGESGDSSLSEYRQVLAEHRQQTKADGADYATRIAAGEPLAAILSGKLPVVWAHAQVVYDSPEKRSVEAGTMVGWLMNKPVAEAVSAVQSELLMITPYLIPGKEGMQIFRDLHQRDVRVRILTSSLESSEVLPAQAGYMGYRVPLLESGVELYEIRSLLGNSRGSGQTAAISQYGNYSLHAKLFVLDRQRLFIGSMNFDQRSMHLNTEIGLIIDSPVLAQQAAARFEAMVQPVNSYRLSWRPASAGRAAGLVWSTNEDGKSIDYDREPARSDWQRIQVNLMTLVPMDSEL